MKRILVEKGYGKNRWRYTVQSNTLFGFIPWFWTDDIMFNDEYVMWFSATFSTLAEAQEYCGTGVPIVYKNKGYEY